MVFYGSFIKLLKCLFLVAITAYFVSMFVYPFFVIYCDGDYFEIAIDLKNLVDVLLEWQTLNAAMIALFSSVLAFYVSVYTAKIEKERNFIASKVFLPNVFAELTGYFESSINLLFEIWSGMDKRTEHGIDKNRSFLKHVNLPDTYRVVFKECIKYGDRDASAWLTNLINRLQIQNARLEDLCKKYNGNVVFLKAEIYRMLYYTSLVKAIMDKNYNYARGIDSFKKGRVKYEDLENEYSILGVNLMERPIDFDYDYLLKMSKSALEDEKYFI